jgi:hypothetical protein
MMHDELILSPFRHNIVGPQGAILLRRNTEHAERCAAAIRRRRHPAWSQFNCGFKVAEGAEA